MSFAIYRSYNRQFEEALDEVDMDPFDRTLDHTKIPASFDQRLANKVQDQIQEEAQNLRVEFERALKSASRDEQTQWVAESDRLDQLAKNFARDWILEKYNLSEQQLTKLIIRQNLG